eukprot:6567818-Ditylum_brightwellii.AAC.1
MTDICDRVPGAIFKNAKFMYKRFLTCFVYDRLSVRGASYSTTHSELCPLCHTQREITEHVLYCNANQETWDNLCDKLTPTYKTMQINLVLRILLTMALKNDDLCDTIENHSSIEWD